MSLKEKNAELCLKRLDGHLQSEGYSVRTAKSHHTIAANFLTHLEKLGVDVGTAEPAHVESYLRKGFRIYHPRQGSPPKDVRDRDQRRRVPLHVLLSLTRGQWPPTANPANAKEAFQQQLRNGYREWLSGVRGLSPVTISDYCAEAHRFLDWLGNRSSEAHLPSLSVADLDGYIKHRMPRLGRRACQAVAIGLRNILRYLYAQSRIIRDLSTVVVAPRLYSFEGLPRALPSEDIAAVLRTTSGDHTAKGLRDYAILMLLSTYGLRAGEVTGLRLADIEWQCDRLRVRHFKTGSETILPLLTPVGESIVKYLQKGRPATTAREIFIRTRAPYRAFQSGSSLFALIKRRLRKAGVLAGKRQGAHAFRHARAVSLLRAGIPLKSIGDILGHRSPDSTAVYLKLATEDLRAVGLQIPKGVNR